MPVTPKKSTKTTTTTPTPSPKAKLVSPMKDNSPVKKDMDAATQALNHFAQGKRHLLVNDINSAVNSLQEACRMLAKQHGETATECGDAYFYYGRALLELSRIESGVLGNALDGVPEGEDMDNSQVESPDKLPAEEKEKVAEQVGEALEENFKSLEKASPSKSKEDKVNGKSDEPMEDDKSDAKDKPDTKDEAKDKSEKDDAESAMDTDSGKKGSDDESEDESQDDESQEGEEDGGEKETEEKEGEKTEHADDVSNLQLAWEMLELAKVIYQRQTEGNKAMSLKTAQVFLKLGEVCLENENYPQSIEDFQSCLKLQEAHMESDDRCLAETHYQLGVAYSFSDQFDEAIESFTKAFKIIEDRVANLEKMKTEKEGWTEEQKKKDAETNEDSTYTEESEIEELNTLIPEIKEKITDMEEMKKDAKDKINKVKKELGMASAIGGTSDAKTLDTSMIRKKRKPEDEAGDDSKKTKAVNGEAKPSENGTEKSAKNGHSSPEKMDTDKSTSKDDLKKKAVEEMEQKTKELKTSD